MLEGLNRRLLMMQESRVLLREETGPKRKEPLDAYLATELAVHVNALYLNLCGSLDNMAWMLAYEWAMRPNLDENDNNSRRYCNLFGGKFLENLGHKNKSLAKLLRGYIKWNRELRDFRDPAAHRIPLYVAPGFLANEKAIEKYHEIGREAEKNEEERGRRSLSEIFDEQRSLAQYAPIIIRSSTDRLEPHSIPEQIGSDYITFLTIAEAVIGNL
jgi:hypothetical protein